MKSKIAYHRKLYIGDGISQSKLDKIKRKLEKKPLLCSEYLITFSSNPGEQLDIFQARQLAQSYYLKYPVCVVGIASDYEEAVRLVETIVQECLQTRGDCSLKEYLCVGQGE